MITGDPVPLHAARKATDTAMVSIFEFASPKRFMELSDPLLPWLAGATAVTLAAGFVLGFRAPPDYQQGDTFRIMFVHVPATWTAMMAYGPMAVVSIVGLVNRHPLADVAARAPAPCLPSSAQSICRSSNSRCNDGPRCIRARAFCAGTDRPSRPSSCGCSP